MLAKRVTGPSEFSRQLEETSFGVRVFFPRAARAPSVWLIMTSADELRSHRFLSNSLVSAGPLRCALSSTARLIVTSFRLLRGSIQIQFSLLCTAVGRGTAPHRIAPVR